LSAATQVYYDSFDAVFFKLAPAMRARIEGKIDRRFKVALNRLREHIRKVPTAMFLAAVEQHDSGDVIQRVALPENFLDHCGRLPCASSCLHR
jgi:hypothetical protein